MCFYVDVLGGGLGGSSVWLVRFIEYCGEFEVIYE